MSLCIGDEHQCEQILDNNLDEVLATWLEVYKIFCISCSDIGQQYAPEVYKYTSARTWKAFLQLSYPRYPAKAGEHRRAELHVKLMELEDIHGVNMVFHRRKLNRNLSRRSNSSLTRDHVLLGSIL